MTTVRRTTPIGIAILLAVGAGVARPSNPGAAAAVDLRPAGWEVLRQSSTVMQRSLHALRSEGRIQLRISLRAAQSRVSGDCAMKLRFSAVQFWVRGSTFVNGVREPINEHYITVSPRT